MECSCEIECYDDGELCEFYLSELRTARKQHKCCECKRIIEVGEKYEYARGKWGGDFDSFKTCSDCVNVRQTFFTNAFYHEGIWEEVNEYVNEADGDIPEDCIVSLTPKSRDKICEMIERIWESRYGYQ